MIDLDEMVKRNQGKDFAPKTTSYAETHPIPVADQVSAPPMKAELRTTAKGRKLPKRGAFLILILAITVIGSIVGIGALASGTLPGIGPGTTTTTPTVMRLNVETYTFNATTLVVNVRDIGSATYTFASYTMNGNTKALSGTVAPNGVIVISIQGSFTVGSIYTVTLNAADNTQFTFSRTY